ncbi:GNAT family N-acetyltransferase [Bacillus atrophaeus]|uniref:GNAT family N-acetyltransferase n=1 Tax=Bacillus atrophaeus TaxID=1452 RepID=UPI000D03D1C5|nr:GNAT family protein [Bacillus atrophaeus]PRR89872.1 N-acetyltransferase [Bacillus atrophaeus]
MVIRPVHPSDSDLLLALFKQLDQETDFMLYEPNERTTTSLQQKAFIESIGKKRTSALFISVCGEKLTGFVLIIGSAANRQKHVARIVIGVLKNNSGQGTGSKLLQQAIAFAEQKQLKKLELTVMTHNKRAVHLYKKHGFIIEGTRKKSLMISGEYADEYFMGKDLTEGDSD